jgi:hypothetical protein
MMGFGRIGITSSETLHSILDSYRDPFATDIDEMDSSSVFEEMIEGPKDRVSHNTQRAIKRVQELSHANAVTDGQRARMEIALHETAHKHHGSLVANVLAARPRGSAEAIEDDVRRIMHTVAKISRVARYDSEKLSDESDDSDKDVCARIPAAERGKYPWCKDQPDEITGDVMDLIRLITKGKAQEVVDRALKQRGYSRYEIRKAAKQYAQSMKRVLQTHRAFDSNVDSTDASSVIEAVNELAQNPDFVQHMIELMAMHLPPDYPWRAESITSVCKWWIMQYLSMVRPQLVHAVISCPDKDPYKCSLLGLSLGGNDTLVKWHGSSSVQLSERGSDETQIALMISKGKWAELYRKFEADRRALRGGKRRGAFAKIDPQTRTRLNDMATAVDKEFKAAVTAAVAELGHSVDPLAPPRLIFDLWSKPTGAAAAGVGFGADYGTYSNSFTDELTSTELEFGTESDVTEFGKTKENRILEIKAFYAKTIRPVSVEYLGADTVTELDGVFINGQLEPSVIQGAIRFIGQITKLLEGLRERKEFTPPPSTAQIEQVRTLQRMLRSLIASDLRASTPDGTAGHAGSDLFSKGSSYALVSDIIDSHLSRFDKTGSNVEDVVELHNNPGLKPTLARGSHAETARRSAGYVVFKGATSINARHVTHLLDGIFSADEETFLITEDRLASGIVRYGVSLDGASHPSKRKSSMRRLLRPTFANQLQRYAENMGAVKSAVSSWSVFLFTGQDIKTGSKNSPETTAVAMNVFTQIAMKVVVAYGQSVQRFYETAAGLSVNLSSSTVTSKTQETPEESSIYGSLDESDSEFRGDDDLDTITSLF